jgi:hypothetical protein
MPGTSETAYWEQDGMYLSQTVGATAITLGTVVEIGSTDGYVVTASSASTVALGVAIAGYRTSRTATDNSVAAGGLVTVATRGIVNVPVGTGTVTRGELVTTYGTGGAVATVSGTEFPKVLGLALSTSTVSVKVKLMRG